MIYLTNKKIHKIAIHTLPEQVVKTEAGADFISVQLQNNKITLWYIFKEEDLDLPEFEHIIYCVPTGQVFDVDKFTRYLGTVIDSNQFVWHIFKGKGSAVRSAEEKLRDSY